jgi:hypothetical protein
MTRFLSMAGMGGFFMFISAPMRADVLNGLARVVFALGKYSPYSYVLLALALGTFAVKSLAPAKPQ